MTLSQTFLVFNVMGKWLDSYHGTDLGWPPNSHVVRGAAFGRRLDHGALHSFTDWSVDELGAEYAVRRWLVECLWRSPPLLLPSVSLLLAAQRWVASFCASRPVEDLPQQCDLSPVLTLVTWLSCCCLLSFLKVTSFYCTFNRWQRNYSGCCLQKQFLLETYDDRNANFQERDCIDMERQEN